MNTIYDGSYTLGSTSALSFEAGPGIKIDEPSAGTVRIGTDETVLWSGTYNASTTSVNLSESYKNFEEIDITWTHFGNKNNPIMRYDTNGDNFICLGGRGDANGNPFIFLSVWTATSETNFVKNYCRYFNWNNQTATPTNANEQVPIKIVGVNRKEV